MPCNLTFDPWKSSDPELEPRKRTIKRSNTLFTDQKTWSQSQTLQQATYKWLPLAVADWISGNDRRLAQSSKMWVTDYSARVSGWTLQNPGVTREMRVSWKFCCQLEVCQLPSGSATGGESTPETNTQKITAGNTQFGRLHLPRTLLYLLHKIHHYW